MATQAELGKKALAASNYDEAIKQYTAALQQFPTSPDYLIQRSTAYHRANKYPEAVADAEQAVLAAHKRAKREAITEAQFRRACALYNLGRYGDAQFVFGIVKRLKPDHKMIDTWVKKSADALNKLADDDEKRKVTVKEVPEVEFGASDSNTLKGDGKSETSAALHSAPTIPPQQTPADKIRHDWYQNDKNVYYTLLAKGVPEDQAQIQITERSMSITFPLLSGSSYDMTLDPLFAAVNPAESKFKILPNKIEIVLVKAVPGRWKALEGSDAVINESTSARVTQEHHEKAEAKESSKPTGPVYPTSSKSGPKDWDKIAKDLRKADKGSAKSGLVEDDDDDDDEGGGAEHSFFKKLFKNASPDAQRAMMKSYTESNGTALSTDWSEVSKGKVETCPPNGMEEKKWAT
ncbi:hypothetical protein M433DRAFT_379305 [Acidomyces richmondensis BFW]|nr:MAG: hypothetical protein FE78DRAFT_156121 [Acidomyces sp. 'richmondensis']KYG42957.1 hypothetical protein M433DRAFT_379305 [Acidomyces richmondensis BFW]